MSRLVHKQIHKIRLRKGDTVMIRSGRYKGKSGKILAVHASSNKVTVEGINVVKRHRKPSRVHPQGAVTELTKPLPVSKVGLLDVVAKKPSRIGYKFTAKDQKVRYLKSSGKEIK